MLYFVKIAVPASALAVVPSAATETVRTNPIVPIVILDLPANCCRSPGGSVEASATQTRPFEAIAIVVKLLTWSLI
jgi:hypothetical protein